MTPEELKKWRKEMGLTQPQAADIMGYTRRQWQKYEGGVDKIRGCMKWACIGYALRKNDDDLLLV